MKMRRITATLLVLTMLLVCLPMQTRAEGQSATLSPQIMEQVQAISITEDGVIVFSNMEDMKQILMNAHANPNSEYLCFYFGFSEMSIDTDMTIPENMTISMNGKGITVNAGKRLTVKGVLDVDKLDINGSLLVSEGGIISVGSILNIGASGAMDLKSTLYLNGGLGAKVEGKERISYGEDALAIYSGEFFSEEDLWWATVPGGQQSMGSQNSWTGFSDHRTTTVWHRKLYSILSNDLHAKRIKKRMDI